MFRTLLIANRGEIAVRIARTAKRLAVRSVGVYSDADAGALHTRVVDTALRIGPARARDSYLNIDALLTAARQAGADALHPGYGFLAESAELAERCAAEGIVFVGPPPAAIRAMGLKDHAKKLMQQASVPVVPGYSGENQDDARLVAEAARVGFPLLIKAIAGGGGKGMRIVREAAQFATALQAARGEAERAFGDGRVILERFIEHARHIEVQVMADSHGQYVHLFERDCSLQRRHQKVIEEAPASALSSELRARLHAAAIAAARAVQYQNAGTIEFVVSGEEAWFLEMNTRLQVEHPVTEMVLGIDMVEWQLRIAAGERVPLGQDALRPNGHAFEARIYAEDPRRDFLPSGGVVRELQWPAPAAHLRIDAAVEAGDPVVIEYDALLAKLVVHGATRSEALARLVAALRATRINGVATNLAALISLASDPAVAAAKIHTRFIDERGAKLLPDEHAQRACAAALALAGLLSARAPAQSAWDACDGWTLQNPREAHLRLQDAAGDVWRLRATQAGQQTWDVSAEERSMRVEWLDPTTARIDRRRVEHAVRVEPDRIQVWLDGEWHRFDRVSRQDAALRSGGEGVIRAPMPGAVLAVHVHEGQEVARGQPLLVLEAMKMEHPLHAGAAGVVSELRVRAGERVREGDTLLQITARRD